jgi:hypothetical protein
MALNSARFAFSFYADDGRTIGINANPPPVPLCNLAWSIDFAAGSGASQFTTVYAATRTLGGSSEDLDLSGVLADAFGGTISATEVKGWGVVNLGSHNLTIGGTGGSNWTTCLNGTVTLPPGSACAFGTKDATGWTVTNSSADLLHVAGTSGDSYQVVFFVD